MCAQLSFESPVSSVSKKSSSEHSYDRFDNVDQVQRALLAHPQVPYLSLISPLFQKRIKATYPNLRYKGSTRAYFILETDRYLRFEKGKESPTFEEQLQEADMLNLILVGEMVITIMYLINHRLDGKYGVTTPEAVLNNQLEQIRLEKALDQFIQDHFSPEKQQLIQRHLKRLFRLYHQGNLMDQEAMNWDAWQRNDPATYHIGAEAEVFVKVEEIAALLKGSVRKSYQVPIRQEAFFFTYLTRSYLINGLFFQIFTELLIQLGQAEAHLQQEALQFARLFGTLQQLVNDTTDYVPVNQTDGTTCKLPQDTFSDARRGMITLPIACGLSQQEIPAELIQHYSGHSSKSLQTIGSQSRFLQQLQASNGLRQAMSMGAYLGKQAQKALHEENPATENLQAMCEVAFGNRLYKAMNQT